MILVVAVVVDAIMNAFDKDAHGTGITAKDIDINYSGIKDAEYITKYDPLEDDDFYREAWEMLDEMIADSDLPENRKFS